MQIQASLPFISPLGSPPCTTRLVPSAGSPSFKCRSAPVLLVQSLSCCWEVAFWGLFFSYSLWFGQGATGEMLVPGANWVWEGDRGSWRGTGDILGANMSWPHPEGDPNGCRLCLGAAAGEALPCPRTFSPKQAAGLIAAPQQDRVETRWRVESAL